MRSFRPKLWTGVGVAVLLGAGLEACSNPQQGPVAASAPAKADLKANGEVGESGFEKGERGEGGPEGGGEEGAQAAFANIPDASKTALRLAQLEGFVLIALKQTEGPEAGGVLLGQGLLETYDKRPDAYPGIDESVLRKAAKTGATVDLQAALANIEAAERKAGGDPIAVSKGLVDIASGLYQGAVKPGALDPIDYQHSLGAALAAEQVLGRADRSKAAKAAADMRRFVALWPQTSVPAKPTPAAEVAAQASRVELELS